MWVSQPLPPSHLALKVQAVSGPFRGAQEHSKWEYGISTHSLLLMLPLKETEPLPRLEYPLMGLCGGRDGNRVREHSAKGSVTIMYLPSLLASFLPQTPPHHHNFFSMVEQ